jgi:hypothetical protein
MTSSETEPALRVVTVYQDPVTRHWAAELWERVGQLLSGEAVCHRSWKIGDLTSPRVFNDAVQAAAEADVLVVAVRDGGEWPMDLPVWVEAWLPRRAGPAGALVALIGVPPEPEVQPGRAYQYLDTIARKAGLDFLPRERKLPNAASASSSLLKVGHVSNAPVALPGRPSNLGGASQARWRLNG